MTADFLCGAASRIITPALEDVPVYLAGFSNGRRATGVESDLYVRALAFRLGETTAAIVGVDLIGLDGSDVAQVREELASRDIDPSGVMIACTHTHSGPDTIGLWGPDRATPGVDARYLAHVKTTIVEAVIEALTFCCPVRLRAATTALPGYIANFRDPDVVDDSVAALQFVKIDEEVVGTIINLACHPEVLWDGSTLLSPDYAGAACRAVESAAGGMALHLSGALGGMLSPDVDDTQRTPAFVAQMGDAYAAAALAALAAAPLQDVTTLTARRAEFRLPLDNPALALAREIGIVPPRPLKDGALTTSCTLLDLGAAQILSVPGEPLPRLGFALKAAMRGPVKLIACIADDEIGYIVPDDEFVPPSDYDNPGRQYEESMSLGPRTGSMVMAAALGLLDANR